MRKGDDGQGKGEENRATPTIEHGVTVAAPTPQPIEVNATEHGATLATTTQPDNPQENVMSGADTAMATQSQASVPPAPAWIIMKQSRPSCSPLSIAAS